MAAALSATAIQPFAGGGALVGFKVVLSGSYSTGGETLDFTTLWNVRGVPIYVSIDGKTGYKYEYASSTLASNGKMKIMIEQAVGTNTPLLEHTAVAYVAGETGDVITGLAWFK